MNATVQMTTNLPAKPLNGVEKVAALLLSLGKTNSAKLLQHFDQEEIRLITVTAAQLGSVPSAEIDKLADEFIKQFSDGANLYGSAGEVEKMLEGVLPEEQLADIMSDVLGNSNRSIWDRLATVSETVFANYLLKEHPQTAALILTKIKPSAAAKVLGQINPQLRNELVRRMLSIKAVVPEIMREIEKTMHEDFMLNLSGTLEADSYARMADILNKMDRDHMEDALENLNDVRPKTAELLKGLLFTFDDIVNLNARTRMAIFDQIPTDRIVMALKGTDANFREVILSSLTSRARRIAEHELAGGEPAAQRDVLEARSAITNLALEMASRGEVELNPKQDEGAFFN
ncbi:flagellar motor switch protein FliG [Roseibium polysiphoniae]|uniref:Flagellar motor switch protein FliG n=1 Tax=Roseibium polysiphoniae TaxID=2571221 RepID=A0A927Q312_9HYPH|nr:flagellar motor switch protein FliG [Roseibium polysiphoniae]MBD8877041.1 flagellar motor switch protein FliG [Roseibium polysiphoniae]MBS8260780.1 flagellar motor switch protein FliG [Roseibium polysiphoniae]